MIEDIHDSIELIGEEESSVEELQQKLELKKESQESQESQDKKEALTDKEDLEELEDLEDLEDLEYLEYVDIAMAATMADRSEKTIRNWLKADFITGKKEDPSIKTSRWLISRESLMGYLATSVDVDPPRKGRGGESKEIELPPIIEQTPDHSEELKALKEQNEALRVQLEELQKQLHKKDREQLKNEHQIELLELRVSQKEELLEVWKQSQPDRASIVAPYEYKIEKLSKQLSDAEQELVIVRDRYHLECSKGLFARIFSPPQELQLLVDRETE